MCNYATFSLLLLLVAATSKAQDSEQMKKKNTMNIDLTNNPLTCSLSDAALVQRKNELQVEIFSKLKKVEEVDEGYSFYFDDTGNLLSNLFYYILAEKKCCPFFQHEVSVGADSSGIVWTLSGKDGTKEMLRGLLENVDFPD